MPRICALGPSLVLLGIPAALSDGYAGSRIDPSRTPYTLPADRVAEGEILLWPQGAPGEAPDWPGPEVQSPVVYPPGDYPGIHVTNVSRPTLAPYLVKGSRGAVIVAPGGGYVDLAHTLEGTDVAKRLNAMGVSVFLLKYRVPLRPPAEAMPYAWAQLQDAQRAVSVVRGRSAEWGLDPRKVAFLGFSAGGHLTAHVSTAWQHRLYEAVDAYDAVSCRPDLSFLLYPWRLLAGNDPWQERLAPEIGVRATTPPAFVAGNGDDRTAWPQNFLQYYKKLRLDSGVASTLHVYPSGGHGFGLCQAFKRSEDCCEWPVAAQRVLQDAGFAAARTSGSDAQEVRV